jgi:hypothetical protein
MVAEPSTTHFWPNEPVPQIQARADFPVLPPGEKQGFDSNIMVPSSPYGRTASLEMKLPNFLRRGSL